MERYDPWGPYWWPARPAVLTVDEREVPTVLLPQAVWQAARRYREALARPVEAARRLEAIAAARLGLFLTMAEWWDDEQLPEVRLTAACRMMRPLAPDTLAEVDDVIVPRRRRRCRPDPLGRAERSADLKLAACRLRRAWEAVRLGLEPPDTLDPHIARLRTTVDLLAPHMPDD